MFSLAHLFYGIIAVAIGTLLLKYNYQLVGFTGRQDWIEDHLGSGTTYLAYKLFAIVIVLGGVAYATGLGDPVMRTLLSPLKSFFPQ